MPDQRLRVLFLLTRDWSHPAAGGGDLVDCDYARELAGRGHDVTIVAERFPGSRAEETAEGVRILRRGGTLWLWWNALVRYRRLRKAPFDVVIAEGFGGSRIPRLAPLYVREPIVTEWHSLHGAIFREQYGRTASRLLMLLERVVLRVHRGTFLRVGTPETARDFVRLGVPERQIHVVPPLLADDWFRSPGATGGQPRLVCLGKFRRYKCAHHVVEALPEILRAVPDARLILAGRHDDRAYESQLRTIADRLGVSEHLEIRFNLSEEEKRTLLQEARALVMPAPIEGFGIVAIEANALGVPVVASDGVPASVVSDGENGRRYPFGDRQRLSNACIDLLRDDALWERCATGGRSMASQYQRTVVGDAFEALCYRAAAGR